jgi:hypothetical protein
MSKIISVVPNISEGNDQLFIAGLVEKLQAVRNLVVLDTSRDSVRNRTVFSFTGPQEAIFAAGLILYRETLAHVDMRKHRGEYPRLGAVDVFPFVPLKEATIEETVAMSAAFAQKVAEEFKIPVYLYGESARFPMRRYIEDIREGEYEGLENKLKDPRWKPDFGPATFNPPPGPPSSAPAPHDQLQGYPDTPDKAAAELSADSSSTPGGLPTSMPMPAWTASTAPDHHDHATGLCPCAGRWGCCVRSPALAYQQGGDDRPGPESLSSNQLLLHEHPGFLLRQDSGARSRPTSTSRTSRLKRGAEEAGDFQSPPV